MRPTMKPGLELPLLDLETEVIMGKGFPLANALKNGEGSTIFRAARIRAYRHSTLTGALTESDRNLAKAAKSVGAKVVSHAWYLQEYDGVFDSHFVDELAGEEEYKGKRIVPDGHILVSEVEVLSDRQPLSLNQLARIGLAKKANDIGFLALLTPLAHQWSDMGPRQFINGKAPSSDKSELWLTDIEPMLTD